MTAYDPNGWNKMVCNFCGTTIPHKLYISILIATNDSESAYPFTQTDMCKKCWDEFGIDAAIEHNQQCKKDI